MTGPVDQSEVLLDTSMEKFGKSGVLSALVLPSARTFAGGTHGDSPVGEPDKAEVVTRTINVDMTDNMRFWPAEIAVKQGEAVRFVVRDSGAVKHEVVLGSPEELKEHYAMMLSRAWSTPTTTLSARVGPGKTGDVVWRFTKAGKVNFACPQPGQTPA